MATQARRRVKWAKVLYVPSAEAGWRRYLVDSGYLSEWPGEPQPTFNRPRMACVLADVMYEGAVASVREWLEPEWSAG